MLCTCTNGQLESCCRHRREWSSLSSAERQNYISVIRMIATDAQYKPLYDDLIALHKTSYEPGRPAQNVNNALESQFIPWHRYFLLEYEDLIRLVDSSVTIPYWDWTPMRTDPYSSIIFDPVIGFGNSSDNVTRCVNSGPFREGEFMTTPSAGGGCLEREYLQNNFPSRALIEDILAEDIFVMAHNSIQQFVRFNVRCLIGGHMCSSDAANDPLYLSITATIDQIMSLWQSRDPQRETVRYASDTTPLDVNLGEGLVVSDFALNTNLPNGVSVCYSPLPPLSNLPSRLQGSPPKLRSPLESRRIELQCHTDATLSRLGLSQDELDSYHRECSRWTTVP